MGGGGARTGNLIGGGGGDVVRIEWGVGGQEVFVEVDLCRDETRDTVGNRNLIWVG